MVFKDHARHTDGCPKISLRTTALSYLASQGLPNKQATLTELLKELAHKLLKLNDEL